MVCLRRVLRPLALATLFAFASVGAACGSGESEEITEAKPSNKGSKEPGGSEDLPASALLERPWEIVSKRGETYLPNVFYADASENEQVMPWTIDGKTVIDRLVYPTIGNPNLYVKSDADDELVVVLRIEPDAFAHLAPRLGAEPGNAPREVTVTTTASDGFAFFLVDRVARERADEAMPFVPGNGSFAITPSKILMSVEPEDMPAVLRRRKTLRFVFDKAAMAAVPAGLYDARFEVRKDGKVFANVFETQANAVRVFDREPEEYTALNVTDTQVSLGLVYETMTADKFDDFVDAVNASADPQVRSAPFITFNGDLHNGGAPGTIRSRGVATTYDVEAKRILSSLKRLSLPIFLTVGNHDGYASLGHVPGAVASVESRLGGTLEEVVGEQNQKAWPEFSWDAYSAYLAKTDATREGLHHDLVSGGFRRAPGDTFAKSFSEVPHADRNMVLYDGFHQWQKTYGPLHSSWTFGKNRYVSVNSYELRQHRRTGWGMYTVNYGGAIGRTQLEWIDRELLRGKKADQDIILLMHHDPRGGHKGQDFGYYFPMLAYRSVQQSTINYLLDEVFTPAVCSQPDFSVSVEDRDSCLHDGLQEWMAPDEEYEKEGSGFYLSGVELLKRVVRNPNVRTLLLGHAHFNTLEVKQPGDELVPTRVSMDPSREGSAQQRIASLEVANPVRRTAWEESLAPIGVGARELGGDSVLSLSSFDGWTRRLDTMLAAATPPSMRTLSGDASGPHELAIVRLTSGADLSSQKYGDASMFGWSLLHVTRQTGTPRINRLTYFVHTKPDAFAKVATVDIDRTKSVASRGADNPLDRLFDW